MEDWTQGALGAVLDGKVRLDALLGKGGMGAVFAATHLGLEREVAVKLLHPVLTSDPSLIERFFREARAVAKLDPEGTAEIFDLDVDEALGPFIVMERLNGESLAERLPREGALPRERAVRVIIELLDVLALVHREGIVHRDLKPGNVFLHRNPISGAETVKVLDFGVARVTGDDGGPRLTLTGERIGTPRFMAPEQVQGQPAEPASDLYAVGLLLGCCLTGKLPFHGLSDREMYARLPQGPVPLRELAPELPEALLAVSERALAQAPEERFADAGTFADALRATLEAGPGADEVAAEHARNPAPAPAPDESRGSSAPPELQAVALGDTQPMTSVPPPAPAAPYETGPLEMPSPLVPDASPQARPASLGAKERGGDPAAPPAAPASSPAPSPSPSSPAPATRGRLIPLLLVVFVVSIAAGFVLASVR
ncbi:MAG: serine/threonine-protein kinase [Myxococcota bacterium]